MSTTADRIFSLLEKKGIEQKEFARLIGTSDKTVSAWKMGRAKSYTKYLSQIAEILETTVDYLVNGNSDILITRHDLPPQGSLTELLDAGESAIHIMFVNAKEFILGGSESLISRLNSPTCALYSEIKFYDRTTEQTEKPIILPNNGLSETEQSFIGLFQKLTPEQQALILAQLKGIVDAQEK